MTRSVPALTRHAGPLAALCCAAAVIGFGAAFAPYSHAQHPLALLGARGVPHAQAFNLFGFVIPGVLAAIAAMRLRAGLPINAGWATRIGARLWLLSALAFTAQGLLPLDPAELDGPVSQWHATSWTLWWLAFVPGALLLALGLWRVPGRLRLALLVGVAGALVLLLTALPAAALPGPIAQRLALAIWLGCFVLASRLE